ncbi:MAG: hypothetical protein QXG03_07795, partial [Halalkalicoccus sp.]
MRRSVVITLVLFAIALSVVGAPSAFTSPSASDVAPEEDDRPETVQFEDAQSGFWPYLNARESFEKRSPINVVVRGETEEVVRLLTEEGDGEWVETDDEREDAESETYAVLAEEQHHATGLEWGEAAGTTRYAWIDPGNGDGGHWTTETLQLDNGDYYGHRMHIRLYESPNSDDRWVAMQAHTEHFDWFTLRHRVDGVEAAQLAVEREFMELPSVDERSDVTRINLDNAGPSDSDGWATLVDLTGATLVPGFVGLAAGRRLSSRTPDAIDDRLTDVDRDRLDALADRIEPGHLLLGATILALFLGVRFAGIALERYVEPLSMHAIAALLYPVIALGIPAATDLLASGLERRLDAAVVASLSLAVAIWLDYGYVGVDSLPIDVV